MSLLLDETAVVRRDAGFVRVTGHDRLAYLHTLLSQDLSTARPGMCADFLYLDHKGNALAEGRAVVHAEAVILVVAPEVATDLAANLEKFTFLLDAEAADLADGWGLASVRGPPPLDVPGARREPMTAAPHGDGLVVRDRSGGVDLLGSMAWVEDCVAGLGLPEASPAGFELWRIRHGIPAWGAEIVPGRRPQELGLLPTHVHLRKGCYPGQESVAKVYNLGRPRRVLAVVSFDGPVTPGERLEVAGKTGEVSSSASVAPGSVALALLPSDRSTGEVLGDGTVTSENSSGRVLHRVGAGLPQPGA